MSATSYEGLSTRDGARKREPPVTDGALRGRTLALALAGALLALAMSGGGYAIAVRNPVGIAVWWSLGLATCLGLWPVARLSRHARGGLLSLLAFTVLTGLSAVWADSPEDAVAELGRVTLYLGVLALVMVAARPGSAARWCDGLAIGLTAVGLVSLASRLLPGLGFDASASRFFPEGFTYLSYPLEYWNGLAVLIALALPLLLRTAVTAAPLGCGLAVGAFPALAGVLYLTSSRGGILTALVAVTAFVALSGRRTSSLVALAVASAGSVAVIGVLSARGYLVDGPFGSSPAITEGRGAAILVALVCTGAGLTAAVTLRDVSVTVPRLGRTARRALVLAAVLGITLLVVAADPVGRLESFSEPPVNRVEMADAAPADLSTGGHLTSTTGNGRWQFWTAAVDEFRSWPLTGRGAGSYEAWWAEHGSISYFTRQAHSLYLETLGELGLPGLALLLALLASVAAAARRRLRESTQEQRITVAALCAVAAGFAVAAGIDWMWEMTVVAVVGISAFGLIAGPASDAAEQAQPASPAGRGARAAVLATSFVAIAALALPWLAQREIRDSRDAALAGKLPSAVDAARTAARLTPWAASPHLQRALVLEGAGRPAAARAAVLDALEHDPSDWRTLLVLARVEQAAGRPVAAGAALRRASALSPRSPVVLEAVGRR